MEKIIFKVERENINQRLDLFLKKQKPEFSRSQIKNFIISGNVLKNGQNQKSGAILKENDIIELTLPNPPENKASAENLPLEIVYQDCDLAVINKKQGMVVHAGNANYSGTLVNALLFHIENLSNINGELRPGIVHRLDKNTSGLMLVAKNNKAHLNLAKQISKNSCVRKYLALLEGNLKDNEGIIKTYIARNPHKRTLMSAFIDSNGDKNSKKIKNIEFNDKSLDSFNKKLEIDDNINSSIPPKKSEKKRIAITEYRVIERFNGYCLVEFSLKTGRTHQIRAHCRDILHHPIVGDIEYGGKRIKNFPKIKPTSSGQYLHAFQIEFTHPTTNKPCIFNAELPEYFKTLLEYLKAKQKYC